MSSDKKDNIWAEVVLPNSFLKHTLEVQKIRKQFLREMPKQIIDGKERNYTEFIETKLINVQPNIEQFKEWYKGLNAFEDNRQMVLKKLDELVKPATYNYCTECSQQLDDDMECPTGHTQEWERLNNDKIEAAVMEMVDVMLRAKLSYDAMLCVIENVRLRCELMEKDGLLEE